MFKWLFGSRGDEVTSARKEPTIKRRRATTVLKSSAYAAAAVDMFVGDMRDSSGSADYDLMGAMRPVRQRVRAMSRNSGTGSRAGQLLADNVVGENGFRLAVRVKTASGKLDKKLNTGVEAAWAEFCEQPSADGEMDMIELEKQMVRSWATDGEYIIEIVNDPTRDDGFYLNPLEADMLDETLNGTNVLTGNRIKMGVEIDVKGAPVAYHFLQNHPGDTSFIQMISAKRRHRRVTADRVIHIFMRLRAGQTRGAPPFSSTPKMVKMLDGYREAEVTGRRVKASAMGLIIDKDNVAPNTELDGMATDVTEDDNGDEQYELEMIPGTFSMLPAGKDFKQFDPGGQQSDYDKFEKQVKTDISMGIGISPVSLGYETSQLSYSTHRGIISEDREMYRGLQSFFIRMGIGKVYRVWLLRHVTFNPDTVIAPTRYQAVRKASKFMARGWDQIDPTKDTRAEMDQLKARTTSWTRIAAKRGLSLEDLLEEIASDEAMLVEYGLTPNLEGGTQNQTISGGDSDDDDEGSEGND